MEPTVQALVTLAVAGAAFGIGWLLGKSSVKKTGLPWEAYEKVQSDPALAQKVHELLHPPPAPPGPPKPSGVPVRFLALLQREGRLIDFLLEDISAYPDAQIGAAVRDIHRKSQTVLKEHLVLEPVLKEAEGATVRVPAGFDPSAIQLIGNVTGQPPFQGTLQHHGWRATEIKLPALAKGQDDLIVMPAEVEIA